MMTDYMKYVVRIFFALIFPLSIFAQGHPSLLVTEAKLAALREGVDKYPLLRTSFQHIKNTVDQELSNEINVPLPQDAGGGYTHELHKKNYQTLLNSAIVYQITQDQKYFLRSKQILLQYADKYQSWPEHPKRKENHPSGRIFWQNLNDCVWLVHAIQAYDLILTDLSDKEKQHIEKNLFHPMVEFFMMDHKDIFDKIHNHGTWSIAAVGITGLILGEKEWVDKSIYGSALDKNTGFLKQLDELFSPDGYYAEGPYYQRYALLPFVLFAKALHNYRPELDIYSYRDKLLAKAIETVFQTSYTDGLLFPINDAIKDKSIKSNELVLSNNLVYADIYADPSLLGMAQKQGKVTISDAGLQVATDIFLGKSKAFDYKTTLIRDGKDGKKGGLGIIRNGDESDQQALVLKNTTHGMGHGHFDRLNFLLYDKGGEIFLDYGAARFLNIESKFGGHYLRENNSWAKQTIAHNSIVIDETSQFAANVHNAESHPPIDIALRDEGSIKYMWSSDDKAYPHAKLSRILATITVEEHDKPIIIDISIVKSQQEMRTVDLPYYYLGQVVDQSQEKLTTAGALQTFGQDNGYQHLWLQGSKDLAQKGDYLTLLANYRFYKIHFAHNGTSASINHVHLGANDPDLNLLPTRGVILRQKSTSQAVFAQLVETYGHINPTDETITDAISQVKNFAIDEVNERNIRVSLTISDKNYSITLELTDHIISNVKTIQL